MAGNDITAQWLPNRDDLHNTYVEYLPSLKEALDRFVALLNECVNIPSVPSYKARVKDFNSLYRKLLRVCSSSDFNKDFEFSKITDFLGVRIICPFLQDIAAVEKCLSSTFSIVEVERKGSDRTFREFGYESTHVLIDIPLSISKDLSLPEGLLCEIQIRTILQDAWAEVEHELVYKSEFSPFDLPLKRKLASINASLSLADIIFQEIRDYQTKLNKELDKRRGSFYNQADIEASFSEQLQLVAPKDLSESLDVPTLPYVQGTIDDMLLDAIEAHNKGNLDKAIEIYSGIIETKPNEIILSVIYKHRGMAYFAQSKYLDALSDFRLSAQAQPTNFRAYYYIGIALSVLGNDIESIEYFDKSLHLNPYQPYVYYRKAFALYNAGNYSGALVSLDKSVSLGFKKDQEKQLRLLIAKKIDGV